MKEIRPKNSSFLRSTEIKVMGYLARYVPQFMGTKTLTFMSLFSSILVFCCYYFASSSIILVLYASVFILSQWIFDCLDGTIGRLRKEGLVRWGFYMDHLFDLVFMSSIIIGWIILMPEARIGLILLYFICVLFMASSFLMFGADQEHSGWYNISFLGVSPIEFRMLAIIFNALYYLFNGTIRVFIKSYMIYADLILLFFLVIQVYINQRKLSERDVFERAR
jgi:phosphatidylglycerophosphate synthase